MWSWLSKLDPNAVAGVASVVLGVLFGLKSHREHETRAAALLSALRHEATILALQPNVLGKARGLLTNAANALLVRMKLKPEKFGVLVHWAVELALQELVEQLAEKGQLEQELAAGVAKVADQAAGVADAFTPKGDFPQLSDVMTIEKVGPDEDLAGDAANTTEFERVNKEP